jgi:hypothetical protein
LAAWGCGLSSAGSVTYKPAGKVASRKFGSREMTTDIADARSLLLRLEQILPHLDRIGALLAAAHVSAAVDQMRIHFVLDGNTSAGE